MYNFKGNKFLLIPMNLMYILEDGQANKSTRGMPWHQESMKDVISCDKPRGAANRRLAVDFRMGEPGIVNPISLCTEYIGTWRDTR